MSEMVELRFTYTEEEYVTALRQYFIRFLLTKFDIIFAVVAILVALIWQIRLGDSVISFLLGLSGTLLLMFNFIGYFINPRQAFRREAKFQEEYLLQFSEEGIIYKSKGVDSNLQWSLYHKVVELREFYFLFYAKDMFTIIPKRVFTGSDQEEGFRNILKKRITTKEE